MDSIVESMSPLHQKKKIITGKILTLTCEYSGEASIIFQYYEVTIMM